MAIFLATLSLPSADVEAGKLGILLGSWLSACAGAMLLARSTAARSPVSAESTRLARERAGG